MQDLEIKEAVSPQVYDGETGLPVAPRPVTRRRRRLDLETVGGVADEMRANYRLVRKGKMDSGEAYKRAFLLRQISDLIVIKDLERRIGELESSNRLLPA